MPTLHGVCCVWAIDLLPGYFLENAMMEFMLSAYIFFQSAT